MKSILLTLATALIAHAGPEAWLQKGLITPEMISAVKSELELSTEQEASMQSILKAAREKAAPMETTVRERQQELNHLLKDGKTTAEQAAQALTSLLNAEEPVKQLQLRTLIELRDLLNPDQQKKALTLAPGRLAKNDSIQIRVHQKAEKLRAAVESLGIKPTLAMSERGRAIEGLIKAGAWADADAALEKLSRESRAEEPAQDETPDFSQLEPGNTDLEELRQRYTRVEEKAQQIISLPLIRQFLKAKEAFEEAKQAQDAEKVGRILTWAERQLEES
jgi:Spy/CpxP family protein refolding chaperone